jgi:hypothetical protein
MAAMKWIWGGLESLMGLNVSEFLEILWCSQGLRSGVKEKQLSKTFIDVFDEAKLIKDVKWVGQEQFIRI